MVDTNLSISMGSAYIPTTKNSKEEVATTFEIPDFSLMASVSNRTNLRFEQRASFHFNQNSQQLIISFFTTTTSTRETFIFGQTYVSISNNIGTNSSQLPRSDSRYRMIIQRQINRLRANFEDQATGIARTHFRQALRFLEALLSQ